VGQFSIGAPGQFCTGGYTVADLKRQVGKSSKEKFEQLVQATKEARDHTNQACLHLAWHVCSVRCIFTLRE
jgi:hypothetical protein